MSQFSATADFVTCDEPRLLSFTAYVAQRQTEKLFDPSERARTEQRNQSCPCCSRVTVEPIELRNGRIGRNGALIPGTGTLVGFSCYACGHEWPVHTS